MAKARRRRKQARSQRKQGARAAEERPPESAANVASPTVAGDEQPGPSALSLAGRGSPRTPIAVALLVVFLGAGLLAHTGPIANNDYGLHLRIGEEIADSGLPARADHHSHTAPGARYPDHEWLTQLSFFAVHRLAGDGGMVVLRALTIGLALALVFLTARGGLALRLACAAAVLLLGLNHGQMRPHLVSWVMAALLMLLLERRHRWAVPLLLLLWGNCHGSVLLAVGMAVLHFAERYRETRERQQLLLAASCAVAPLLNPQGPRVYTLFFEISGHTEFIGEWQAYSPGSWPFWLLVGITALAAVGWLKTRPRNPFDLIRCLVLAALAFQSSRNGVVAAIFFAPMFGRWYANDLARWGSRAQYAVTAAALAAALLVAGARTADGRVLRFELDHQQLPIAAVRFIEQHELTGPIYNDYNFGGYLLWKSYPRLRVFIDGRTEVYKGRVLDDYLRISRAAPGWPALVDRYGIQFFLVRPERAIAQLLVRDPRWDLVYFDYNSVIYVRKDLFPELRRLAVVTPYGHRDRTRVEEAIGDMRYLLDANPRFFGGYKILAFLLYRRGDLDGARSQLDRYLELRPSGRDLDETQELIRALRKRGAWR